MAQNHLSVIPILSKCKPIFPLSPMPKSVVVAVMRSAFYSQQY